MTTAEEVEIDRLNAEIERLRAAFNQALYSLCCDNYEEQQIVAAKLKTLIPTKGR